MTCSLYIFPQDLLSLPANGIALTSILREAGFIGDRLSDNTFAAGDALLTQIIFTGCSPQLEFSPPDNGSSDFCHVAMHGPFIRPQMITGPHTLNPRCPSCKRRVSDWRVLETAWHARDELACYTCPCCGLACTIDRWRWRRHAVFGRFLIAIRSVFPGEAIPSDTFLLLLNTKTDVLWDYGWAATISA